MATENSLSLTQDPWSKLADATVESILARLPVADYFRGQFVCKRWESVISSLTFPKVSKELFHRRPWFLLENFQRDCNAVYDMEVDSWRHNCLSIRKDSGIPSIPLAASNSLICCISGSGMIFVCNPINGSARDLYWVSGTSQIKTISMQARGPSYIVFVVCWISGALHMITFSSVLNCWTLSPFAVFMSNQANPEGNITIEEYIPHTESFLEPESGSCVDGLEGLPSVTLVNPRGELVLYYIEQTACLVACYIMRKIAVIYPPLPGCYYRTDLVGYRGRLLVLTLADEYGNHTLRVWGFGHQAKHWINIAVMPRAISQAYNAVEPMIECTSCGDYIMVCASAHNFSRVALYNVVQNTWRDLPTGVDPQSGEPKRFCSAFAIMPNIQDKVECLQLWKKDG